MPNLSGRVCLVTGGSRGIGKGIAVQLATYGATCYVTGRDETKLEEVKKEAAYRGGSGKCIPVRCDHSNDTEVESVFKRIEQEQNGKLDLLVNNAYAAVQHLLDTSGRYFWENPPGSWDVVNNVGLRSHYVCAVLACRLMVPRRKGLIINISSVGGKVYFQIPLYGIGKAAKDRMARDCAAELQGFNVAFLSLWPGPVKTELVKSTLDDLEGKLELTRQDERMKRLFARAETAELSGKCVAHLLADKNVMTKTGQIFMTADLAVEYGFKDVNGLLPANLRSIEGLISLSPYHSIARYVPSWLKIPKRIYFWAMEMAKATLPHKRLSVQE